MHKVSVLGSLLASVTALVAAQLVAAQTSDVIDGCGRSGPRIEDQTGLGVQDRALTVPIPEEGTFFSIPARPDEAPVPSLVICHVESDSSIVLEGRTGQEVTRSVGGPGGNAVLDEIVAAAYVSPVVLVPPPTPSGPTFTPPITGDAGMKH